MEQYCFIKIVDILKEEVVITTFAVDVMLPSSGEIRIFLYKWHSSYVIFVSTCYSEQIETWSEVK